MNVTMSDLLSLWRVQESLLQSYRRLFLTIEAILLSVGAISINGQLNCWAALIILVTISGVAFFSGKVFIPIIVRRGESVFFVQAKILKLEQGQTISNPLTELKAFQADRNHPFYNDPDYLKLKDGDKAGTSTREKLSYWFPFALVMAWIGIFVAFLLS